MYSRSSTYTKAKISSKRYWEENKLDPKRIYKRLVYLRNEGFLGISTIFPLEIDSNLTEEKDTFDKLKLVLKCMIEEGLYPSNQFDIDYDYFEDALSQSNAKIILENVTSSNQNLNNPSFVQQIRDQFLHLISDKMKQLLEKGRNNVINEEDGNGSANIVNNDNIVTEEVPSQNLVRDDIDDVEA